MFNSKKIAFIGAHFDDIELSCGGTIKKILSEYESVSITYIICSGGGKSHEDRKKEQKLAAKTLGVDSIIELGFQDGKLEHNQDSVKKLESAIQSINPDIIFTHALSQSHQDHIAVHKMTLSVCRHFSGTLITYPSYWTHCIGLCPFNFFVDISNYFEHKQESLSCFTSQANKTFMDKSFYGSFNKYYGKKYFCEYVEPFTLLQAVTW